MMDITTLRKELHQYIDTADGRVLNMLYAMIDADNTQIVAYTTDGKPLTINQYNKELEKAEQQIEQGNTYTHEQVKERVSQWTMKK